MSKNENIKTEWQYGLELLRWNMLSRIHIDDNFMKNLPNLFISYLLALDPLASLMKRYYNENISTPSQRVEGQIILLAQFIIGIERCESGIREGLYLQSTAILKQQIEIIAGIDEHFENRRRDGKTPKIGRGSTCLLGPIYGKLNEYSHASRYKLSKNLSTKQIDGTLTASMVPIFDADLAKKLYGLHVHLIVLATQQADRLFKEIYGAGLNDEENERIAMSQAILISEGLLEIPPNSLEGDTG